VAPPAGLDRFGLVLPGVKLHGPIHGPLSLRLGYARSLLRPHGPADHDGANLFQLQRLLTIPEYRLDVDFIAYWQIPPAKLA
jgi:hypothetical protein